MKLPPTLNRAALRLGCVLLMGAGLAACGGGSSSGVTYSIGGRLSGLGAGKTLVLQNNGGDDLTLSADGGFTFATPLGGGSAYEVTVLTQPADQSCTVSNGVGTLFGLNVTDVAVSCVTVSHSIGGRLTGLGAGKSLVLQNNGGDDLTLNADGGFVFATALQSGSAYNVTVLTPPSEQSCTVTNAGGTVAGADVDNVAVVCRAWGAAALIEHDDTGAAGEPQVAADGSGNAVAVWAQSAGSTTQIRANRYVAGSGWLMPLRIDSDNSNAAVSPQIAMDGTGNAVVVWTQSSSIWTARYTVGVGWNAATNLGGGTSVAAPQIAVDADGDAVAVWQQTDGAQTNIWADYYLAGWGWVGATTISDGTGNAITPQVAADSGGNAVAVWAQSDGVRTNIWANRYTTGGGWGAAALIETDNSGDAAKPQVAATAGGEALAVWQQSDGSLTNTNIWANRYSAATGWEGAQLIEHNDAGPATDPRIAVDGTGNGVAVWAQSDSFRYNILANRYTAGGGWGTAALIETDDSGDAALPQVAIGANGNAVAVWQQSDGSRTNIWTNRYTAGGTWDTAALLETDNTGAAQLPRIAVGGDDQAVAVWQQSDGSRDNIWANLYR